MHERFNFIDLANSQNSNRIFLDLSFQSEERWNDKQRQKFIKSVLANRCPTPIVLAVVESCMEYCARHFGEGNADVRVSPCAVGGGAIGLGIAYCQ